MMKTILKYTLLASISFLFLGLAGCSDEKKSPSARDYVLAIRSALDNAEQVRYQKDKIEFLQRAYDIAEGLKTGFPDDKQASSFLENKQDRILAIPEEVKDLAISSRNFPAFKWAVKHGATFSTDYNSLKKFWDKGAPWRNYILKDHPEALPVFMELAILLHNESFFNQYAAKFKATGNKLVFPQDKTSFNALYRRYISEMLLVAAQKEDPERIRFLLNYLPPMDPTAALDFDTQEAVGKAGQYVCNILKDKEMTNQFIELGYGLGKVDLDTPNFGDDFRKILLKNPKYTAFQVLKLDQWHGTLSAKTLEFLIRLPESILQKVNTQYIDQGIEFAVKTGEADRAMQLIKVREETRPLTPHDYDQLFAWSLEHENSVILDYAKQRKGKVDVYGLDLAQLAKNKKLFVLYAPKIMRKVYKTLDENSRPDGTTIGRLRRLLTAHHPEAALYIVKNYDLEKDWVNLTFGRTLLMDLCEGGNLEAVKYLLEEKHADIQAKTGYMEFNTFLVGRTRTKEGDLSAIFFAAKSGNADLIRYLVSKGENVNARSNYGATPLMYAVSNNKIDSVNVLIELQADVNAQMNENLGPEELRGLGVYSEISTAYHRAKKLGNPEIIQTLKKAGARP